MNLELSKKSVLITGGSKGIGLASAKKFVEEGAIVTIVARNETALKQAARGVAEIGGAVRTIQLDLSADDGVDKLREQLSTIDVLVNCAGSIPGGGLDQIDDRRWRESWELKVYGYINATRYALSSMMKRGNGTIVNIIGIAGAAPRYDYICGSAANAALISFTEAAGSYSTSRNVRVVGINPGATQTDRLVKLYEARATEKFGDAARWPEMLSHLPFGRPAHPEEIADLVVFLSSNRASYLSGCVVDASGGAVFNHAW